MTDYKHLAERLRDLATKAERKAQVDFRFPDLTKAHKADVETYRECLSALTHLSGLEEAAENARVVLETVYGEVALNPPFEAMVGNAETALRAALQPTGLREMDLQDLLFGGAKPLEDKK